MKQKVTSPPSAKADEERPVDARLLLAELAQRWRGAQTLDYRSEAVLNHAGEFRVTVQVHARLRRPNLARVVFLADQKEFSQTRVCDGRLLFTRGASTPLRRAYTLTAPYKGRLTENIAHPLDEIAYTLDQFFERRPFTPLSIWGSNGSGASETAKTEARREKRRHPVTGKMISVFRIRFSRGVFEDLLFLEPVSLRPLELIRTGDHAGQVQKLLHETFLDFRLGANLPPSLFTWTAADEARETLR